MAQRDSTALELKIALKRIRHAARLEASIRVDRILFEIEDDFREEFHRRVAAGEPIVLAAFDPWVIQEIEKRMPEIER